MRERPSRKKGLIGFAFLIWTFGNSLLQAAEFGGSEGNGDQEPKLQVTSVIIREAVSASGEKFQQVSASGLGESWRDPSGLIWGEVLHEDGGKSAWKVSQDHAADHCREKGARLPTQNEYARLRQWLTSGKGKKAAYRADILPQLDAGSFWTETSREGVESGAYIFNADDGDFSYEERNSEKALVRCVSSPLES